MKEMGSSRTSESTMKGMKIMKKWRVSSPCPRQRVFTLKDFMFFMVKSRISFAITRT